MEDVVRLGPAAAVPRAQAKPAAGALSYAVPVAATSLGLKVLAGASLVLCLCDALFTLILIESNLFFEANPVMDALMQIHDGLFVASKLLITGASLAVLLRYSHRLLFGRLPVAHLIAGTFGMYLVLVGYEVAMLTLVI